MLSGFKDWVEWCLVSFSSLPSLAFSYIYFSNVHLFLFLSQSFVIRIKSLSKLFGGCRACRHHLLRFWALSYLLGQFSIVFLCSLCRYPRGFGYLDPPHTRDPAELFGGSLIQSQVVVFVKKSSTHKILRRAHTFCTFAVYCLAVAVHCLFDSFARPLPGSFFQGTL